MAKHAFIFASGYWIGEGRIAFSASPEYVHYYTRWQIEKENSGLILCQQEVEMQGGGDNVHNRFQITSVTPSSFAITLENDLVGKVSGKGVIDDQTIAWEFRGHSSFEGFEVYELQDNGDYMVHAEYASPDQFRTIIDGRVWQKST